MTKKLIACILPVDDAEAQVLEWKDLADRAQTRSDLPDGSRLTFDLAEAAAVEDLAARESACCAFLDITTERTDTTISVTITCDDPEGVEVIRNLGFS